MLNHSVDRSFCAGCIGRTVPKRRPLVYSRRQKHFRDARQVRWDHWPCGLSVGPDWVDPLAGGDQGRARECLRGEWELDEPSPPPRIVIADDNHQNVELLEAYLGDFDCEIRTAHDGEETVRVVEEFRPDLLLLDVMMPRLSGFEVCRKLRANDATRDLLILMVTALNEASDFERGVQAGADDFLTKPVNKIELLCRIRGLLRVKHLKTQLDRTLAYLAEFEAASRGSTSAQMP